MTEDRLVDFQSAKEARERLREILTFNSQNGFTFVEESWREIGNATVYVVDSEINAIHVFPWAPGKVSIEIPSTSRPWELLNLSFEVIADPKVYVDKTHILQSEAIAATSLNAELSLGSVKAELRRHILAIMDLSSKSGLRDLYQLEAESLVLPRHRIEAIVRKSVEKKVTSKKLTTQPRPTYAEAFDSKVLAQYPVEAQVALLELISRLNRRIRKSHCAGCPALR